MDKHNKYRKELMEQIRSDTSRKKWARALLIFRLLKLLKKIESLLPEKGARREFEQLRDNLMYGF